MLQLPPGAMSPHGSAMPTDDIDNDQMSTSSNDIEVLLSETLFQPPVYTIQSQHMKTRVLHFQQEWFQKFKWLHYAPSLKGVLCFICCKAEKLHMVDLANKRDPAFIFNGFRNWKKALESFRLTTFLLFRCKGGSHLNQR